MRVGRLITVGVLVAVCVGAVAAAYWIWADLHTAAPLPAGGVLVSVPPGEPFGAICGQLQAAGVVRHGWVLRAWARWRGVDRSIRNGDYRFAHPLSPLQVLALLRTPMAALHRVTIPEGSTVAQVAAALAAAGFGGADQFRCLTRDPQFLRRQDLPSSGLEGYLFPDTYAFAWDASPRRILSAMVERFREKTAALQTQRIATGTSQRDMVILASLIEKETGAAAERALVSAVFHNRLRLGMPLQSDPTTVYGKGGHDVPTHADVIAPSPYNTYLHLGLPPGPICNPGLASLRAAIAPAHVPYLYFVSRNDGTHVFSRTLAEHNRAVARFQRRAGRAHTP